MLALQCKEGRAACANLFINPLIDGVPASWSKYCALEIFTNMGPWQKTWRLSSEMKGSVVLCFGGYWSCCYSHHIHKWIIICIRLSILFSFLKQLLREIQYQIFNPATFIVGNRSFYTQIWGICSCKSYISAIFYFQCCCGPEHELLSVTVPNWVEGLTTTSFFFTKMILTFKIKNSQPALFGVVVGSDWALLLSCAPCFPPEFLHTWTFFWPMHPLVLGAFRKHQLYSVTRCETTVTLLYLIECRRCNKAVNLLDDKT